MATRSDLIQHIEHCKSMGWMPYFVAAAAKHGVRLEVLLAIASRETEMGQSHLLKGWRGDRGHGNGIMQIDDRAHPDFCQTHAPDDHKANITYGALVLRQMLRHPYIKNDYAKACAAYNCGQGNVRRAEREKRDPDYYTMKRNYGSDVIARSRIINELIN